MTQPPSPGGDSARSDRPAIGWRGSSPHSEPDHQEDPGPLAADSSRYGERPTAGDGWAASRGNSWRAAPADDDRTEADHWDAYRWDPNPDPGEVSGSWATVTPGGGRSPRALGRGPGVGLLDRHRRPSPSLTVLVIAAVAVLLGGAMATWFLLRDKGSTEGAREPVTAVEAFLNAVYNDRNAEAAVRLVCSASRDSGDINAKIEEIESYERSYRTPRFRWDRPRVEEQDDERAIVITTLRMITQDEKTAEQTLRFTVVRSAGWWVCEVDSPGS